MFSRARYNPQSIAVALMAGLLWLLCHPYQGIYHDGVIYGLMAARWLHPEQYAKELFFLFGSQDDFSLFSPLYGGLARWLGLDLASQAVVLAGGMLWVVACLRLATTALGRNSWGWFAALFGAASSLSYAPNGVVFVLNENFATARSLAMPLGLMAVAALLSRHRTIAGCSAVVATLVHPLIGGWALLLVMADMVSVRRQVAWFAIALASVFLLSAFPLTVPGLRPMSGEWLTMLSDPSADTVHGPMSWHKAIHLLQVVALLGLAGHFSPEPARQHLYWSMALLAIAGQAVALSVSYFSPIELLIQAQPWRVYWLAIPLACLGLLELAQRYAARSVTAGLVVWAIGLAWYWAPDVVGAGLIVGSVGLLSYRGRVLGLAVSQWCASQQRWMISLLTAVSLFSVPFVISELEMSGQRFAIPWWGEHELLHGMVAGGGWALPLLLAFVVSRPHAAVGLAMAGVVGLALVIPRWDHRGAAREAIERCFLSTNCVPHPFSNKVLPGDVVHWPDQDRLTWFTLHAAAYVGGPQGAGRVFSEAKFYEFQRRRQVEQWPVCVRHGAVQPRGSYICSAGEISPCLDPVAGPEWIVVPDNGFWASQGFLNGSGSPRFGREALVGCREVRQRLASRGK